MNQVKSFHLQLGQNLDRNILAIKRNLNSVSASFTAVIKIEKKNKKVICLGFITVQSKNNVWISLRSTLRRQSIMAEEGEVGQSKREAICNRSE